MSPATVVSTCLGLTLILGGATACIPKAEIDGFHDSGATVADAVFETDGSGRVLPDASSMGDAPENDTQTGPDTICVPDCTDRECGDDGCQGSCGSCDDLVDCSGGACECVNGICGCLPECGSRECGSDGCGGVCGHCEGQDRCSDEGICECEPDCGTSECGDDGCGGSCGDCIGMDVLCVEGSCVCQPDCSLRDCGSNGCGGSCGSCNAATHYCGPAHTCLPNPCETARCGVCDEIDINDIDSYEGDLGTTAHNGQNLSRAVFRDWPITAELKIAFTSTAINDSTFTVDHFPGDSWSPYTNPDPESNYVGDGAGMVVCYHRVSSDGIHCKLWDWWSMERQGVKDYDWPAGRPVAHMMFSVEDQERTNIKYYDTWPYNNVSARNLPLYNTNTIGTDMDERDCN